MGKINILLIDQSAEICRLLQKRLTNNKLFLNIDTVTTMEEAITYLDQHTIQVVILDVTIKGKQQVSALREILSHQVLPVIIFSEPNVSQMAMTVKEMSNGAIDFIKKIDFDDMEAYKSFETLLIQKLLNVNRANRMRSVARKVKESPLDNEQGEKQASKPIEIIKGQQSTRKKTSDTVVAIGTSTGGPRALHQLIQQIPKSFHSPILIVQHMPAGFTKSLSDRLNNIGNIKVKEAVQGERIEKGTAYIAPGNFHLQVRERYDRLYVELTQDHEELPHRPSVDLLFKSVAKLAHLHKIAVVLTGMGRDGAEGVKELKTQDKETVILAESKESAVINGMPKAVVETNLVTQVFKINEIGTAIVEYTNKRGN